ncbi:MAG: RNA polymerase sigma factor [Bryobacterales bacterium]|nr:RNA polymerase sigma factor [Bryobacterales bacterium]
MGEPVTPASFGALYERHSRDVYRFALALTGNVAQAEDLTAEAFLRVWEAGSRVEFLTVRAYLLTIVRNLYRREWRRGRWRGEMPDSVPALPVDPAVYVELERVLRGLSELPRLDREVLVLRAEGGLSYEEIAASTGLTAEAARLRAHRARKKLMEVLCGKT